ncbi:MAG TPA: hypothetical protein VN108_07775 [Marmoricola sp.]|nr:hypothetical protein [Marmoricola sp.]
MSTRWAIPPIPQPTMAGAAELLRQGLRRDRVLAPASIALFVLMAYASAFATDSLYHSTAAQLKAVTLVNDQPGILALYGPIDTNAGVGALAMSKMTVLYALFAAGVFVAIVRRHTRVEEESGRAEFLAGTSMGRNAALFAAVVESSGLALLLGALCGLAAIVGGLPVEGSTYFGLSWIGTGLVATGIAAVCCQLSTSARACAVAASATLAALYVIRAIGDSTTLHWLDWLSPFGWNIELHAWSQPRPWVVLLYLICAGALFIGAQWLRSHRDLDGGVLAARPGAVNGASWLGGPVSLGLRVHRTMVSAWSVAVFSACVFFGAITPALNGVLKSVGSSRLTADLGGSLMVAILSEFAVIVSCFAIVVITHAAADELSGRAELVLTSSQSRTRWFAAVAGQALVGITWLMTLAGLGMWLGDGIAHGADPVRGLTAALVWIPAMGVICGLALLTIALRPDWTPAAWVWPLGFWVLALVPPLFSAPSWVAGLSPYDHVPKIPVHQMDWTAEELLVLACALISMGAWWRFRTRDIG